jgi:GTP-binding protein Era
VNDIEQSRFGEVAIVGRPNVGKSTLLNGLVGQKISITSTKPHTTRQRILGILNRGKSQIVFVDTPGHARRSKKALHRLMSRTIHQAVADCDLCLLLVEATGLKPEDWQLIEVLGDELRKTIIAVNKLDLLKTRAEVLPVLETLGTLPCLAFVPISARRALNTDRLVDVIVENLPLGQPMYPLDMSTDRSASFRAEELIRGELLAVLHKEVPYGLTVEVEHMSRGQDGAWLVHGLIWLERQSHKPIVIGKHGQQLKRVGIRARAELEKLLGASVRLELWVKVREHWADSERELKRLGFDAT